MFRSIFFSNRAVPLLKLFLCAAIFGAGLAHDARAQGRRRGLETVRIAVSPGNVIRHRGREIPFDRLPRILKRMGADQSTRVEVLIAEDTSLQTLKTISGVLRGAGYGRIVFIGEEQASAEVIDPSENSKAKEP